MKKIILSLVLSVAVLVGAGVVAVNTTHAQSAFFPVGCSSALGYSATNGSPCNGTNAATNDPMPGCTTALGYSAWNGQPCSGNSTVLISFIAGCTSVYGYSSFSAQPCNGTKVATLVFNPGLPTTGDGGNAAKNIALLVASGLVAAFGVAYLVRKPKFV